NRLRGHDQLPKVILGVKFNDGMEVVRSQSPRFGDSSALCRTRVVEEIKRRKGTPTADHLKLVLSVIEGPVHFALRDE
ncbi:MAG: hypothetical protein ACLQNV_18005, partial [Steroidobacteraceae bacterium]